MHLAVPPAFALGLTLGLLGTQVASMLWPRRPNYLAKLALSAAALVVGESLAALGLGTHLAVGDAHPVHDLGLLALFQWAGRLWVSHRQPTV